MLLTTYTRSDRCEVYQWLDEGRGRGKWATGVENLAQYWFSFLADSMARLKEKKSNPNHDHWQSHRSFSNVEGKRWCKRCFHVDVRDDSSRRLINVNAPWNSDCKNIREDVFCVKRVKRVRAVKQHIKSTNLILPSRSLTVPTRSLLCENYVVVQRLLIHDVEWKDSRC